MSKNEVKYIDIEPFMADLCKSLLDTNMQNVFLQSCKIYDLVRRAQKSGSKECKFTFNEDGTITFDDGLEEIK